MSRIFGNSFGFGSKRLEGTPSLNLTPMIDVMTIILIFLVKSYSITPEYLSPASGVKLSVTSSDEAAQDRAVLIVSKKGLEMNGQSLLAFQEGRLDKKMQRSSTLAPLEAALSKVLKSSRYKGNNTLIIQADREISFDTLKPILRSATQVGYHDIKFAGIFEE